MSALACKWYLGKLRFWNARSCDKKYHSRNIPLIELFFSLTRNHPHKVAPVAQWIEHRIPNPGAAGPIPAGGTSNIKGLQVVACNPFFSV